MLQEARFSVPLASVTHTLVVRTDTSRTDKQLHGRRPGRLNRTGLREDLSALRSERRRSPDNLIFFYFSKGDCAAKD
jgi:hypothetical protein